MLALLCLFAASTTSFTHFHRPALTATEQHSRRSRAPSKLHASENAYIPIELSEADRKTNENKFLKRMALSGFEPGFGGFWPGNPDAKRHKVTIISGAQSFTLTVPVDRYIFFYFEEQGIDLPIVNKPRMCRQGCCTVCTAGVRKDSNGDRDRLKQDAPLGLLKEFRDAGFVLTCCSYPSKDNIVLELQSEDKMYIKQWGESFEGGGKEWGGFFMDED
jgi:hypothetical protein